jgi:hypothetical protein
VHGDGRDLPRERVSVPGGTVRVRIELRADARHSVRENVSFGRDVLVQRRRLELRRRHTAAQRDHLRTRW